MEKYNPPWHSLVITIDWRMISRFIFLDAFAKKRIDLDVMTRPPCILSHSRVLIPWLTWRSIHSTAKATSSFLGGGRTPVPICALFNAVASRHLGRTTDLFASWKALSLLSNKRNTPPKDLWYYWKTCGIPWGKRWGGQA